jgi:ABC-2 type transport system permease protein
MNALGHPEPAIETSAGTMLRGPWPTVRPQSSIGAYVNAARNEVVKSLLQAWLGKRGNSIELPLLLIFYFAMNMFIGRGRITHELLVATFVGYIPIVFVHQQVNRIFWGVLGDVQSGTLEQLYLSPLPASVLMLGRQLATIVEAAAFALILGVPIALVGQVRLPLNPQVLVPLVAILVGSAGMSLVLTGATLLFKRIELANNLFLAATLYGGGVFIPLDHFPRWMAVSGRVVVPVTQGVDAMRAILLHGQSLGTLHIEWGLAWLLIQPVLYLAGGIAVFTISQRVAMRRGTLGQY